jgi:hypothetical protein
MKTARRIAAVLFAAAALTALAVPAVSASAHPVTVPAPGAARTCTTLHIGQQYQNHAPVYGHDWFKQGYCIPAGESIRASINACNRNGCQRFYGNWKNTQGDVSNANATSAYTTLAVFYLETKITNSGGTICYHWEWYPNKASSWSTGCP